MILAKFRPLRVHWIHNVKCLSVSHSFSRSLSSLELLFDFAVWHFRFFSYSCSDSDVFDFSSSLSESTSPVHGWNAFLLFCLSFQLPCYLCSLQTLSSFFLLLLMYQQSASDYHFWVAKAIAVTIIARTKPRLIGSEHDTTVRIVANARFNCLNCFSHSVPTHSYFSCHLPFCKMFLSLLHLCHHAKFDWGFTNGHFWPLHLLPSAS